MEDQRDQQAAPAPQRAPYAPQFQPAPPEHQIAAPPSYPQGTVERATRLVLRRVARGLILAGDVIRPRLGWVLLTLFLVGVIGLETIALVAPFFAAKITDSRPPPIPAAAAVESFLRGQATFDADMMWDSFSPRFQASLIDKGTSRDQLASQMQSARDSGQTYTGFSYIGGVTLKDAQKMYFYAVDVRSAQSNNSGTLSFVFTVDQSGKIANIQ
ncbi:hypothetical protein K2Z83_11490 [Oscillochloris sp. ZM17-4]|uniref:hypothetical protein n=1 Tax=Oscillochloris sp. ZM17-4 TaxID=2866714 RepID=UPI001C731C6F|nr:hypothetical protein [Oscillochloris sp. ZM17-4]MBX0328298.1 hypothetical protein [Oscillochloris sp. ZM17-4]